MVQAIEQARQKRVDDKLDEFLALRFGKRLVTPIKAVHEAEEGRPIESLWDVTTAVTAYARGIEHQDKRVGARARGREAVEAGSLNGRLPMSRWLVTADRDCQCVDVAQFEIEAPTREEAIGIAKEQLELGPVRWFKGELVTTDQGFLVMGPEKSSKQPRVVSEAPREA